MEKKNYPREFYEYLRKKRVSKRNVVRKLHSWNSNKILDFVHDAYLTLREQPRNTQSIFNFSANASLSGAPFPCAAIGCRLDNLDSLARFATLYADTVYIANPFEKYVYLDSINDFTRKSIVGDILGLLHLRPLFEAGLLSVRNNILLLCAEHLDELEAIERRVSKQLDKARKRLQRRYLKEVHFQITNWDDEIFVSCTGPEYLVEHGTHDIIGQLPQPLLEEYVLGEARDLTKRELKEYGFLEMLTEPILEDIFEQNVHVHLNKTQYLTNREIDFELATSIGEPGVIATSKSLIEGLSHSIPTIESVSVDKIIRLRQKEGEAFEVYRDTLYSVLKQAQSLEPDEMRQLLDDAVRPEIHNIEHTIKKTRKLLVGSLKRDIIVSVGYIAIGLFSGFLSTQAAELIAALGGYKFASSLAEKVTKLKSDPADVLDNPYYFLWKARKTYRAP